MKRTFAHFVRRTAFVPGVSAVYRLPYVLALRLLLMLARTVPEVSAVHLHRSFASRDWLPGYSDIDLVMTLTPMSSSDELAVLSRLWRRIDRLRSVFPFFGTIHVLAEGDLALWLRHGGIRRREFDASRHESGASGHEPGASRKVYARA